MSNANAELMNAQESVLLLVDLQEKFVPYLHKLQRTLVASQILLDAARVQRVPVVVTEHNPERIGKTLPELMARAADAPVLRKDIFSCLGDANIKKTLAGHGQRKTLVVAGCETHICILQTTLDALAAGYRVHVVADAVSSRTELDWQLGLERASKAGAVIATAEMVAYEWLRRSDGPEFKAMLPTFKNWSQRATQM